MVVRQLGKTNEEKLKHVHDGVEKAKQAVSLDIKDGKSWCESLRTIARRLKTTALAVAIR